MSARTIIEAEDPKKSFKAAKAAQPGLPDLYVKITVWMRDAEEPWTTRIKCDWQDDIVSTGRGWEAGISLLKNSPEMLPPPIDAEWEEWRDLLEVIAYNIMEGPQEDVIEDDFDFAEDIPPNQETPAIIRAHWKVLGSYPVAQAKATAFFGGPHEYLPGQARRRVGEAEDPRKFLKSMSWVVRPLPETVYMVALYYKGELIDTVSIEEGWTQENCVALQDYLNWLDQQVPYVDDESVYPLRHWLKPAERAGLATRYAEEKKRPTVKVLGSTGLTMVYPSTQQEAESPKGTIKKLPRSPWTYVYGKDHQGTYTVFINHRNQTINSYFYIETEDEAKELGQYWVKWYERLERQMRYEPEKWKTFLDWYSKVYGMQMKTQQPVAEAENPKHFLQNVPQRTIEVQITMFREYPMDARVPAYFGSRGITIGEREMPGLFITGRDVQMAINKATKDVPRRVTIMSMSDGIADHIMGAVNEGGEVSNLDDRLQLDIMALANIRNPPLAWKLLAPRDLLHYFKNARAYSPEQTKALYVKYGQNQWNEPPKGWSQVEAKESPKRIFGQMKVWDAWTCTSFNAVEAWFMNRVDPKLFCRVQLLSDGPNYRVEMYRLVSAEKLSKDGEVYYTLPKFDFNEAARLGKEAASEHFFGKKIPGQTKGYGSEVAEAETPKGVFKQAKAQPQDWVVTYRNPHGEMRVITVVGVVDKSAAEREFWNGPIVGRPVSIEPLSAVRKQFGEAESPKKAMKHIPSSVWYAYVRRADGSRVYLALDGSVSGVAGGDPVPFTNAEKQKASSSAAWRFVEWSRDLTEAESPKKFMQNHAVRDWVIKWSFGEKPFQLPGENLMKYRYRVIHNAAGPEEAIERWKKLDRKLLSLGGPDQRPFVKMVYPYNKKIGIYRDPNQFMREGETPKKALRTAPARYPKKADKDSLDTFYSAVCRELFGTVDTGAITQAQYDQLSREVNSRRLREAESPKTALKKVRLSRTEALHLFKDLQYVQSVPRPQPPAMVRAIDQFQRRAAEAEPHLFSVVNLESGYAFHQKAWTEDGSLHVERMFKSQEGVDQGVVPWEQLVAKIP